MLGLSLYTPTPAQWAPITVAQLTIEARWQSGYAADCNSVYAGSIPTLASIYLSRPGGGIGRRNGLKIRYSKECAGSSPAPGTSQTLFN
jgi:hypothetical protein